MKILHGSILGVVDKGSPDKPWALIAIQSTSKDRDGFEIIETIKVRVFGEMIKQGYHNSYRQHVGAKVFMPVTISYDNKYGDISFTLAGLPLPLVASEKRAS